MSRVTVVLKTNEGGMWLLPQIEELRRRGHAVTVILPAGGGRLRRALDAAGVPVVTTAFDFSFRPSIRLLLHLVRLRRLIASTRPDALFYHLYASALAARICSLGTGVRRIYMVAGPLYLEQPVIRLLERILCRLDDHVIAGSVFTRDRYLKLGMPPSRLSAIPYGVDTERFRHDKDERVRLFGCTPQTFVVVMVAYVYAPKSTVFPGLGIKGHDTLLATWADFAALHPDSLLVLAGSGFDEQGERHRERLMATYGVEQSRHIVWLDTVDDVRPLYSSADLSVSPVAVREPRRGP